MKELILWKEVDVKDELPDKDDWYPVICDSGRKDVYRFNPERYKAAISKHLPYWDNVTHWLKRVVIPILSDQEIEKKMDELGDTIDFDKSEMYPINAHYIKICTALYKAMQERLIDKIVNNGKDITAGI